MRAVSVVGLPLSEREQDVLVAVVNHGSERAAAKALGLSHYTVRTHLKHIRVLLGARHTTHAAALAYRRLSDRYMPAHVIPTGDLTGAAESDLGRASR